MYEQMDLDSNEILHKTQLLLRVYRDVVWTTLHEADCVKGGIFIALAMSFQMFLVTWDNLLLIRNEMNSMYHSE